MKIRMRTRMAGPTGIVAPGTVIDLPAKRAKELIEAGFAEEFKRRESGEKAVAVPGGERAVDRE